MLAARNLLSARRAPTAGTHAWTPRRTWRPPGESTIGHRSVRHIRGFDWLRQGKKWGDARAGEAGSGTSTIPSASASPVSGTILSLPESGRPPGRGGAVVAVEHREQTASADVSRGNLMLRLAHDGTGMTADALPMVNGKTVPHACSQRNARMTSIQTRTATRAIRVVRSPRNVRTRVRRLAHSPSPAPGKAPRTKATAGPKGI